MWNDAGQESDKRSGPFKLIIGRGLVGVRGQQQTPINKFPENLPTLNRPTSQESSPILHPLFKIISNIGSRPPGYEFLVQDPLHFRVKFLITSLSA